MEKLTDQELDSIFKTAAEGIKPEYDAAAWQGMNERLDVKAKSSSIISRWLPLSFLGLIIFSSGIWIGYELKSSSSEPDAKKNEVQILTESKTVSIDNQSLAGKVTTKQKELETADESQILNSGGIPTQGDRNQRIALQNAKQNRNDKVVEKDAVEAHPLNGDSKMGINDSQENTLANDSNLQQTDTYTSEVLVYEEPKSDSNFSEEIKAKSEIDSTTLDSKKDEQQKVLAKGIFIRGLASPDFSSIDFGSSGAAGSNYALLVEYQFTNRWSVSTGAIRSFKKYSSNGEITYSGHTADNLDGACRILDIPLNVYYRLKPFSKTSFFGGVGLSSYIMLSENYTYTIYTNNGDRLYSKKVEKENNEWFKVLNLSLGIQHQLNSRLYVQAEPFLKAPLAGMGYGDVRLSSLGVFFGVKYKLN
jgi:hypothetical protein